MKPFPLVLLVGGCIFLCSGLPVTKTKKDEKKVSDTPEAQNLEADLEYQRYLKEAAVLETDTAFSKKLEKAPVVDIRNGKIAQELEYVSHNVRSSLDENKRRELDILRNLAEKELELENEISHHLDGKNNKTSEIEDVKKLIKKSREDLEKLDSKRQAEFKEYEMQKQFEEEMIKDKLKDEQRKKFEEEQKALKEKHKKHEKVHHPGNKAQLEEVWEKQDQMDKQDFDPHTFFRLHDVDDNGFWDETEVKALFVKELDKLYQSGLPEDDMLERAEEMERMREHVFKETDTNRDDVISFQEFMEQTKREEYNKDPEWETIDQQTQYTHEDYLEFERRRKEEIDRMIAQGMLPPHPNMPQGYYARDAHAAYQTGQIHPSSNQQQPQLHYQDPQQQYMQQQQQYQQQQQQYHQQQYQQQPYQQQYQYQGQQVQLNPNQVYQQIPVQQHQQYQQHPQQQLVNNLPPQQPAASNSAAQQQHVATNLVQQPVATDNIPQQHHPMNNSIPHLSINNVQQQQQNNIPQKH